MGTSARHGVMRRRAGRRSLADGNCRNEVRAAARVTARQSRPIALRNTASDEPRLQTGRMRIVLLLCTSMILWGCSHASQRPSAGDDVVAAVAAFRTQLQAELKEGMTGGPEHAITVCRDRAPRIAAERGTADLWLGRTSKRIRNPKNAPVVWLEPMLEHYANHPDDRVPRVVRLPDGATGYVEPIYVQPLCLVCHGETVAPAVSRKLAELYPEDLARGYREGDFRGVFWAVKR